MKLKSGALLREILYYFIARGNVELLESGDGYTGYVDGENKIS